MSGNAGECDSSGKGWAESGRAMKAGNTGSGCTLGAEEGRECADISPVGRRSGPMLSSFT